MRDFKVRLYSYNYAEGVKNCVLTRLLDNSLAKVAVLHEISIFYFANIQLLLNLVIWVILGMISAAEKLLQMYVKKE